MFKCGINCNKTPSIVLKFLHMWRNFKFPHNCHTWKAEISPHDNFFSTNIIPDIRVKYQVCLVTGSDVDYNHNDFVILRSQPEPHFVEACCILKIKHCIRGPEGSISHQSFTEVSVLSKLGVIHLPHNMQVLCSVQIKIYSLK